MLTRLRRESMPHEFPSFQFRPRIRFTITIDFDVDHVGLAADWTILDVLLTLALGEVDWNHDLLAACTTNVRSFVVHVGYGCTTWGRAFGASITVSFSACCALGIATGETFGSPKINR